ncbi:TetR family transcriptional regulator [Brevibacterium sp. FAM 24638]|uniref:TetR family transcriptional regulator n=1 Tax=Brevibacterium sp. FAM 24638 TaxID=3415681 RepID=UPI003C7A8B4B
MVWDTEGTKRKILKAALQEFAEFGPDGTTIERIARRGEVNKERIYNYFGGKQELFARVIEDELSKIAEAVPLSSMSNTDIGEYAGNLYDYHCEHPALVRLLHWEGLGFKNSIADEQRRREHYTRKIDAIKSAQVAGEVDDDIDADHVTFLLLAMVAWWSAVPQVGQMLTGGLDKSEIVRRRHSIVAAATKLGAPRG